MPSFGFPSPSSGGKPERFPGGSAKSPMPGKPAYGGQTGGQIMISGPEEKALRVLELDDPGTDEDDAQLIQQASLESGLPPDRVEKLKARAEAARDKGITLKGPTITLQPHSPQMEDGLLGDPMADVGGAMTPAGGMGAAGGTSDAAARSGAPSGGSMTSGATISSAGMTNQRFAPPWRPAMSQATKTPPRMTPDVNSAPPAGKVTATVSKQGGENKLQVTKQRGGMQVNKQPPRFGGAVAVRASKYGPARRPDPSLGQSFRSNWMRADASDPTLMRAYRENRMEECAECGGTCGGRKPLEETGGPGCKKGKKKRY